MNDAYDYRLADAFAWSCMVMHGHADISSTTIHTCIVICIAMQVASWHTPISLFISRLVLYAQSHNLGNGFKEINCRNDLRQYICDVFCSIYFIDSNKPSVNLFLYILYQHEIMFRFSNTLLYIKNLWIVLKKFKSEAILLWEIFKLFTLLFILRQSINYSNP